MGPEGMPSTGDGFSSDISGRRRGGEGRAQMVEVLGALEVAELGQGQAGALDRLGGGTGDGEEEALVGLADGPPLPMRASLTRVTGWPNSAITRDTISGEGAAPAFAWAAMVVRTVRPEVKVEPEGVPSIGTRPRESRAGSPLLARHVNTF